MNNYQWDYPTSTSSYWNTGATTNGTATTTASTGTNTSWRYYRTMSSGTSSTGSYGQQAWYNYPRVVTEQILVEAPDHWTEADTADFVLLVNDKTDTGWHVGMVINGDVRLTDPGINVCSMADFKVKMLRGARQTDQDAIRAFFDAHPTEQPAS